MSAYGLPNYYLNTIYIGSNLHVQGMLIHCPFGLPNSYLNTACLVPNLHNLGMLIIYLHITYYVYLWTAQQLPQHCLSCS